LGQASTQSTEHLAAGFAFPFVLGGNRVTLVNIVVVLVVVGLILWLINNYIPMAASIKSLLNIVVFVVSLGLALADVWHNWTDIWSSHA
jgi:uncharacterized protein YebE (UPF0316 family)